MSTDRESLKEALSSIDFPASKEDLLAHVENYSTAEDVVRALRAIPPAQYANRREVIQATPLDKASEEGQSSSDKAQEARHNSSSALAEHQTEIPSNPIVEELGENRGS